MTTEHPRFKCGKLPARRDPRNIQLRDVMRATKVPASFNFDAEHPGAPLKMFANDTVGDCVMAGRAHQTLRFELLEQKKIVSISDQVVLKEYYSETGGEDTGLVIADSLKLWRTKGWKISNDKRIYKIDSYAEIDRDNDTELKAAIYHQTGAELGILLPLSAQDQIDAGKVWDVVSGKKGQIGSWGGHCVLVMAYDAKGVTVVTWGQYQKMTWAFYDRYCDEAFAVVDAADPKSLLIDRERLDRELDRVTAA